MRIAFIFDALLYGGIERVGVSYLKFLEQDGHDVDVYVLNPDDIEDIINEIPSKFHIYKKKVSPFLCPSRYWYIAKRWWWGKFIFPFIYIIIYLVLYIYGLWFKTKGKYDISISMAGHFNDLSINAYNLIRSDKKVCWLHGGLYSYMVISPGYERLYMKIKNLVVLNNFVEDECLFYNKYLHFNICKIYNPCFIASRPIDENIVKQLKDKYGDFVLMVSRMTSQKNPIGVIKAIEYIYQKYGVKYNVIFLGDGVLKQEFERYAQTSVVSDCIFFIGNETNPQNYYKAAKMFAFSSYSEGLPTVIVEAMYFGLPIVTSDTSVREILRDGKDGLISAIDDNNSLGEDIYKIMSSKDSWQCYSNRSIERFKSSSPQVIKNQFNNFINTLW